MSGSSDYIPTPPGEETPYTLLIRQDWEKWYPRYLYSPDWNIKRKLVMSRENWECEKCGEFASEAHTSRMPTSAMNA